MQSTNIRKMRLLSLALGLGVFGLAQSANAGQWQIGAITSRSAKSTTWDTNQRKMVPMVLAPGPYGAHTDVATAWGTSAGVSGMHNYTDARGQEGATASAEQRHTITLELRWVPNSGQTLATDPPSAMAFVALRGLSQVILTPEEGGTYQADNGLGTTARKIRTSRNNKNQNIATYESNNTLAPDSPAVIGIASEGKSELKLGPFEITGQGSVKQPTTVVTGSYPGSSYTSDPGSIVQLFGQFSGSILNRGVAISSSIEPSYVKSTSPPPVATGQPVPAPVPNTDPPAWRVPVKPGADRHSVAIVTGPVAPISPSPVVTPTAEPQWAGSTTYVANVAGITQAGYKWSFSHTPYTTGAVTAPVTSSFTGSSASTLFLLTPKTNAAALPMSTTATVTVTDLAYPTGSTLTDAYTVKWHAPLENFHHKFTRTDNYRYWWPPTDNQSPEVGPGAGMIAVFDYRKSRWVGEWLETSSTGLELISAHPEAGYWGLLLAGLGIAAGELAEEVKQGPIMVPNSTDTWNESVQLTNNFGVSLIPAGNVAWNECMMVMPLVVVHYDDHFYKCDQYDGQGYKATLNKMKRVPQSIPKYAGQYRIGTPGASATPPVEDTIPAAFPSPSASGS